MESETIIMVTQLLLILQLVEQTNEIVIYSPAEDHLCSSLKHFPALLWTEGAQSESMTHFIFPLRVISHLVFDVPEAKSQCDSHKIPK